MSSKKLIHEGLKPHPAKAINNISAKLELHLCIWCVASLPSLWFPPLPGAVKGNFDVAIKEDFAVMAAVVSDSLGNIILAATRKLYFTGAVKGEAVASSFSHPFSSLLWSGLFLSRRDALFGYSSYQ